MRSQRSETSPKPPRADRRSWIYACQSLSHTAREDCISADSKSTTDTPKASRVKREAFGHVHQEGISPRRPRWPVSARMVRPSPLTSAKPPWTSYWVRGPAVIDGDQAFAQGGHEGRMVRQHAEVALDARRIHLVHEARKDLAVPARRGRSSVCQPSVRCSDLIGGDGNRVSGARAPYRQIDYALADGSFKQDALAVDSRSTRYRTSRSIPRGFWL